MLSSVIVLLVVFAISNGKPVENNPAENLVESGKKESNGEAKFGLHLLKPFLTAYSGVGSGSSGGWYGAQYYGIAKPQFQNWKIPFFNYPFNNYIYPRES